MPFEAQIALRYLLARRKQAFTSVISLVSTLGVAVGVMALIVALALMTGLQGELRDRLLGAQAHIYVMKQGGIQDYRAEVETLSQVPHVLGAAPALLGKALISSPAADTFITVKGIDPELEGTVTEVRQAIESGSLEALSERGDEAPGILIGRTLSEQLGVYVGDTVTLLSPQGTLSPAGLLPRRRSFTVAGIFSLGLFEIDSQWGLVLLPVAQRLFSRSDVEFVQLRVDDIFAAPTVARTIPDLLGREYVPQDWQDLNQSLFSALWMEKFALSLAIGLIVVVAALQIVASLVLLVMEKNPDIGILKTMGASARSVTVIFMLQGLCIGVIGTFVGALGGLGVATVLDRYQLVRVPVDVYQIDHVPFVVEPWSFALVVGLAVLTCFLATVYPSRQAARLNPVEALRYG